MTRQFKGDIFQLAGFLIAASVLGVGVFVPRMFGLADDVRLSLTVFIMTIILWIMKPIPYFVSSLLSLVLLYTLGLTDTFGDAVSGFASNLIFFLFLLLLIGQGITKVDLDDWVATRLATSATSPSGTLRRLSSTIFLIALIVPSGLARAVAFMPIIDQINNMYGINHDSHFRRLSYYIVGQLNAAASLSLMTGGGVAIVVAEMINQSIQPLTWVEWAIYMIPPIMFIFVVCVLIASVSYDVTANHGELERQTTAPSSDETVTFDMNGDGSESASSLTDDQRIVVGSLFVAIVLWIVGSFTGIPTIVPAMLIVLVLSLPKVRIITSEDVQNVNWGIIFLLGAMLSILEVLQEVNAFGSIVSTFESYLPMGAPAVALVAVILAVAVLIRGTFSSTAAAFVIMFPIVIEFTSLVDVNQLYVTFSLAVVLQSTTFLPFNNPTVLLTYERGPHTLREVFLLGLLTLGIASLALILSWSIYWPFVDDVLAI